MEAAVADRGVRGSLVINQPPLHEAMFACVGELALSKLCSTLDQVYSCALIKWVPSQMNMALEHLALPCSQCLLCSHDCSTCWSGLGQQMFQLYSIPKSMNIDLEEIHARIHHVICFTNITNTSYCCSWMMGSRRLWARCYEQLRRQTNHLLFALICFLHTNQHPTLIRNLSSDINHISLSLPITTQPFTVKRLCLSCHCAHTTQSPRGSGDMDNRACLLRDRRGQTSRSHSLTSSSCWWAVQRTVIS